MKVCDVCKVDYFDQGLSSREGLDGVKEYYRSLLGRQHRRSRWRLKAVLYTDISDNSKPHEKPTPRSSESLYFTNLQKMLVISTLLSIEETGIVGK
mgnify:FL=1